MNTLRKLTLEELKEKREALIRNLRSGNTKPVEANEDSNEGTVYAHVHYMLHVHLTYVHTGFPFGIVLMHVLVSRFAPFYVMCRKFEIVSIKFGFL